MIPIYSTKDKKYKKMITYYLYHITYKIAYKRNIRL